MMAAVANGGVLWKPRLVQRVERRTDGSSRSEAPQDPGPRRAVAGGVGVPAPGPGRGRQRRAPGAARIPGVDDRGQDRHRPDASAKSDAERKEDRTTRGSRPSPRSRIRRWSSSCSSSAAARAARSPRPSRARSSRPSSSRRSPGGRPDDGGPRVPGEGLSCCEWIAGSCSRSTGSSSALATLLIVAGLVTLSTLVPRRRQRGSCVALSIASVARDGRRRQLDYRTLARGPCWAYGLGLLTLMGVLLRPHRLGCAPLDPPGAAHVQPSELFKLAFIAGRWPSTWRRGSPSRPGWDRVIIPLALALPRSF